MASKPEKTRRKAPKFRDGGRVVTLTILREREHARAHAWATTEWSRMGMQNMQCIELAGPEGVPGVSGCTGEHASRRGESAGSEKHRGGECEATGHGTVGNGRNGRRACRETRSSNRGCKSIRRLRHKVVQIWKPSYSSSTKKGRSPPLYCEGSRTRNRISRAQKRDTSP